MKRMYDDRVAKLIEKVNQNENITEVGGNLEVDGKLKLNSGFEYVKERQIDLTRKFYSICEEYNEDLTSYSCIGYIYVTDYPKYFPAWCSFRSQDGLLMNGYYLDTEDGHAYIIYSNGENIEDHEIITDDNNYQQTLYRHSVEIKGSNISLCFSTETTNNNPIDSLQDLISQLKTTKLSCSGYIGTDIVSKINIGATATAITFETSGGQKTIASLGTITIEDDVTTI